MIKYEDPSSAYLLQFHSFFGPINIFFLVLQLLLGFRYLQTINKNTQNTEKIQKSIVKTYFILFFIFFYFNCSWVTRIQFSLHLPKILGRSDIERDKANDTGG
jgi:hypothetical protein